MSAIDTERVRADYLASMKRANWLAHVFGDIRGLCDEVDRLRAIEDAARVVNRSHSCDCDACCHLDDTLRDALVAEVRRLRAIVNELAIAYEDAIGCPPHISIGIVEPDRG